MIINHVCEALKAVPLVSSHTAAAQFRVCQALTTCIQWDLQHKLARTNKSPHQNINSSMARANDNSPIYLLIMFNILLQHICVSDTDKQMLNAIKNKASPGNYVCKLHLNYIMMANVITRLLRGNI